jgi:WD40 repeat protein
MERKSSINSHRFGHAFLFDSASSCGDMGGHSKTVNSVSIKPSRPFKAVTASDDFTVNFYNGVPYKFAKSIRDHSRFVQCVRFSPNGEHFVSTSSDSKIFLYDGKTGDQVAELSLAEGSHSGSVFSASWSGDNSQLLTASGDMTAKIWDVANRKVVSNYIFSEKTNPDHQQVGTLWAGSYLITASLSGDLNYLDPRVGGKPVRVIRGHQKGITSLVVTGPKHFYTGSFNGVVRNWEIGVGGSTEVTGQGHTNQVVAMGAGENSIFTCGMDDSFRSLSISKNEYELVIY